MNDRYLFKAKRLDNGEWVQGNLILSNDAEDSYETIIISTNDSNMFTRGGAKGDLGFENWHRVNKNTVCQCTGLKDNNGKLIWENDIINAQCVKAVVIWNKASWRLKWIKDTIWRKDLHFWTNEDDLKCEVVGNVFDNPKLLESED